METKNISVAISGVPEGNDFYGDKDLAKYCEELYNERYSKGKNCFLLVEARAGQNVDWFYYTYFIPQMSGCNNARHGSYFAVTLGVNEHYCEDLSRLYQFFKQICERFIGVFIDKNRKYIISKFSQREDKCQELIITFKTHLQKNFSASFTKWNGSGKTKIGNGGQELQRHVSEYGCDLYLDELFANGKAILAQEITKHQEQIEPLRKQLKATKDELAKTKNKLTETTQDRNQIKTVMENEKQKNNSLQQDNNQLQRQLKNQAELKDCWQKIKDSVDKMGQAFGYDDNGSSQRSQSTNNGNSNSNPVGIDGRKIGNKLRNNSNLVAVLVVIIIAAIVIVLMQLCGNDDASDKASDTSTTNVEEQTPQEPTYSSLKANFSLDGDTIVVSPVELRAKDTVEFVLKKNGVEYTEKVEWGADGFSCLNEQANRWRAVVKAGDTATVSVTLKNNEKDRKYRMRFPVNKEE